MEINYLDKTLDLLVTLAGTAIGWLVATYGQRYFKLCRFDIKSSIGMSIKSDFGDIVSRPFSIKVKNASANDCFDFQLKVHFNDLSLMFTEEIPILQKYTTYEHKGYIPVPKNLSWEEFLTYIGHYEINYCNEHGFRKQFVSQDSKTLFGREQKNLQEQPT